MTTLRIEIQVGPAPNPGGNVSITFTPSGQLIEVGESQYVTEQGPLPAGTGLGTVTVTPPETELGVLSTGGAVALFGVGQYRSLQAVQELAEGVWLIDVTDEAPVPPDPPDPSEGLLVTITRPEGVYAFAEAKGRPLETWEDPRGMFTLTRTRAANPDLPDFWVDFVRSDDGQWASVEFRSGTAGKPANTGPYSVQVDGDFTGAASTPDHWWGARWRMSGSRIGGLRPGGNDWPYPMTFCADLIAERLIPDFDPTQTGQASTVSSVSPTEVAPYNPMGSSSYMVQMGSGGARPDIGLFNDWDAFALSSLAPTAGPELIELAPQLLDNVRTMAEAAASIPLPPMDAEGRAIFTGQNGASAPAPCPWQIDTAHYPETGYVAFILWRDPWDLDTCQRAAQTPAWFYNPFRFIQVRQGAWDFRSALLAWRATPDDAPDWLLPRAHFETWLTQIEDFVISIAVDANREPGGEPLRLVFHLLEAGQLQNGYTITDTAGNPVIFKGALAMSWQNFYCAQAFSLAVYMRPDDANARKLAEFSLTHLSELSGTSEWPAGAPIMYYMPLAKQGGPPFFTSWAEAWEYCCPCIYNVDAAGNILPIPPDYVCPGAPETPQFTAVNANYPNTAFAAASLGVQAGLTEFRAARDWWGDRCRKVAYIEAGLCFRQV